MRLIRLKIFLHRASLLRAIPVALTFVWALTPASAFDFGTGELAVLEDFCTRGGRGKSGSPASTWELRGSKAVVRGRTYALESVRLSMTSKDGRVFVVTSPNCAFDQNAGLARSEAPVHIASEDVTIDGQGYKVFMALRRVRIYSKVHIVLRVARDKKKRTISLITDKKNAQGKDAAEKKHLKKERK